MLRGRGCEGEDASARLRGRTCEGEGEGEGGEDADWESARARDGGMSTHTIFTGNWRADMEGETSVAFHRESEGYGRKLKGKHRRERGREMQSDVLREAISQLTTDSKENKRKFTETIELQIGLKNYDPQKDKRFSGSVKLPHILKLGVYNGSEETEPNRGSNRYQILFWEWGSGKQVSSLEESHVDDVTQVHRISETLRHKISET
ncbi:hypothetical protein Taro_015878 [Colocasia esculenta]|uniref:Uncharacterized protein n=1 Tax=Colocasia esculenta TaxID=4460 RepID=A0A843UCH8_COLES|nr:hypothetical protein [Colocasia esculenta]